MEFIPRLTLLDSTDEDGLFFKKNRKTEEVWMSFKEDGEKRGRERSGVRGTKTKKKVWKLLYLDFLFILA